MLHEWCTSAFWEVLVGLFCAHFAMLRLEPQIDRDFGGGLSFVISNNDAGLGKCPVNYTFSNYF